MAEKNIWISRQRREGWTFPFGSMLGAYAQSIQGQEKSLEKIMAASDILFEKSHELVDRAIKREEKSNQKGPKQAELPQ